MDSATASCLVAGSPLFGLAVHTVSHLFLVRIRCSSSPYPPLALGALANVALTLGLSVAGTTELAMPPTDSAPLVALNLLASLALAFCYFNFVNLTVASLRLRLLEELLQFSPQTGSVLLTRYNSHTAFSLRLQRLLAGGHLVETEGRITSGRRRFLWVALLFDFLRWLIFGTSLPR
jgi:hypothetical protein